VAVRDGDHVETFYANMDCIAELAASLADARGIKDIHIQRSPYDEKIGDEIIEFVGTKFTNLDEVNIIYFE
jgi:hypothetical protein